MMANDDTWHSVAVRGGWTGVDGGLKALSVGHGGFIVGTNAANAIFMRSGLTAPWQAVPGALVQVSRSRVSARLS